jgi:hypothetical protein
VVLLGNLFELDRRHLASSRSATREIGGLIVDAPPSLTWNWQRALMVIFSLEITQVEG